MKLIVCDVCEAVVPLTYRKRSYKCGNIAGKYTDWRNIAVFVVNRGQSRILGISNHVRNGHPELAKGDLIWIIPFNDKTVTTKDVIRK